MITEIIDKVTLAEIFVPEDPLKKYIEYIWEEQYEEKLPNRLLPKPGYTLMFNLGTKLQLSTPFNTYDLDTDVVLPRNFTWKDVNSSIHAFGIKFNFSFIALSNNIYQNRLMDRPLPLKGLVEESFIRSIHNAGSFAERVKITELHFLVLYEKFKKQINDYSVIMDTIRQIEDGAFFDFSINSAAKKNYLSSKTLERYFLRFNGLSPKRVYSILRVRAALDDYFHCKDHFSPYQFGYYDYSHFYKQVANVTGLRLPQYKTGDRYISFCA